MAFRQRNFRGALYDWGAHYIDWLLGIVPGKIKSVRGFFQKRVWHEFSNEDHIDSIISFENGALALVQQFHIARLGKVARRILGSKVAVLDNGDGYMTLQTEVNGIQVETKVPNLKDQPFAFYQNVADHLVKGSELIVKPEQARRTIPVIETTEKSAKAGRELPLQFEYQFMLGIICLNIRVYRAKKTA